MQLKHTSVVTKWNEGRRKRHAAAAADVYFRWGFIWPEGWKCWSSTPPQLLLDLAEDVRGDGWVKVDGVVPETLRCLVTLSTAALERFAHSDLGSVAVLGMVLDAVHVLWWDQNSFIVPSIQKLHYTWKKVLLNYYECWKWRT